MSRYAANTDYLPYIKDKTLFKAVSWVRNMIKDDEPIGLAIWKAAKYYNIPQKEVAAIIGTMANNKKNNRAVWNGKKNPPWSKPSTRKED